MNFTDSPRFVYLSLQKRLFNLLKPSGNFVYDQV
jgi:hypothetical protein